MRWGICSHCGKSGSLHKHHVNYETNEVIDICPQCHARFHVKNPDLGNPKIIVINPICKQLLNEILNTLKYGDSMSYADLIEILVVEHYQLISLRNKDSEHIEENNDCDVEITDEIYEKLTKLKGAMSYSKTLGILMDEHNELKALKTKGCVR